MWGEGRGGGGREMGREKGRPKSKYCRFLFSVQQPGGFVCKVKTKIMCPKHTIMGAQLEVWLSTRGV